MTARTISRRTLLTVVTAALLALLAVSPVVESDAVSPAVRASFPTATASTPGSLVSPHSVVALGDSVTSGAHCDCTPFPEQYAALLTPSAGRRVDVQNLGRDGLTSTTLVEQLQTAPVAQAVRDSDVVLVTIGANDFLDHHDDVVGGDCATDSGSACLKADLASLRAHLAQTLAMIRHLRQDRPTTVLVTGYWNVFEDGQVAQQRYGETGLDASLTLTRTVNATIRSEAAARGADYVDLFGVFQDSHGDIDSLLAADGDHPDGAGHTLIARTLLAAGLPATSWS